MEVYKRIFEMNMKKLILLSFFLNEKFEAMKFSLMVNLLLIQIKVYSKHNLTLRIYTT